MYKSAGRQVKRKRSMSRVRMSTVAPKTKALINLPKLMSRGREINHQYQSNNEVFPGLTSGGIEFIAAADRIWNAGANILNDIDVGSSTVERVGRMIKLQRYHFRMQLYTNVELNNVAIRSLIVFDKKPNQDAVLLSDVLQAASPESYIVALPREVNADRFEILYDKTVVLNGNNQLRTNNRNIGAAAWDITFNQDAATSSASLYEVIDLSPARFYTLYRSAATSGGVGEVDYGQLLSFQYCDLLDPSATSNPTRLPYKVAYAELQWTEK